MRTPVIAELGAFYEVDACQRGELFDLVRPERRTSRQVCGIRAVVTGIIRRVDVDPGDDSVE